jgi:hypothetical protein
MFKQVAADHTNGYYQVLLFFLVFILVIGFLQAYFASRCQSILFLFFSPFIHFLFSLIKGTSLKDGRLPVAVSNSLKAYTVILQLAHSR